MSEIMVAVSVYLVMIVVSGTAFGLYLSDDTDEVEGIIAYSMLGVIWPLTLPVAAAGIIIWAILSRIIHNQGKR